MKNVFIIGSKGIPAKYGGFETFVNELTINRKSEDIKYYVSCLSETSNDRSNYEGVELFNIKVPKVGSATAVLYDLKSLSAALDIIESEKLKDSTIYILACRIGPFMKLFDQKIKKLGVKIFLNPDGHEWKRSKWNAAIRKYWKLSEKLMVRGSDLIICDSVNIEEYIKKEYSSYQPNTTFIPYGAYSLEETSSNLERLRSKYVAFCESHTIRENNYYLIVGRFVPENNYELIIKEFMKTNIKKDLIIVSNVEQNKFYEYLIKTTEFNQDNRIKFVGTVYDQELLVELRQKASGYIHGHEVGGTNPSLLEALATTDLNLLLDVNFNREVGSNAALYFSKDKDKLSKLLTALDTFSTEEKRNLGKLAKKRINEKYSWEKIINKYETVFHG
ncbi:beta 1-4 rhamnosyltransferase Cps2T [Terribacillus sp. JSM ZJ617]|uniref:beta 1-4 rhamnosyltransferase Cps2T n=1 Tax=Terribacillus sp. JSM ZJ617 TaxID=3342119 RepID=UPI0035A855A0